MRRVKYSSARTHQDQLFNLIGRLNLFYGLFLYICAVFSGAKILPVRTLAINLDSVRALAQQVNASCEKVFAAKNKSASSESRWNMNIEINTSSECAQSRVMKFTRASAAWRAVFSSHQLGNYMRVSTDAPRREESVWRWELFDLAGHQRKNGPPCWATGNRWDLCAPPRAGISFLFNLFVK